MRIALGCAIAAVVAILVIVAVADGGSSSADHLRPAADSDVGEVADNTPSGALMAGSSTAGLNPAADQSRPAAADEYSAASIPTSGGWRPVINDEALPCTGPRQPPNFQTLSAGPSIDGLTLVSTERRCDSGPPAARANYISYIYGDCKIAKGATGCQPPLEIQNWPACQRFLAKYSFRGRPLPHRRLAPDDGAEVVEFNFALDKRIEVYTESTTVVIFATERSRAVEAVELLRLEEEGEPPPTSIADLDHGSPDWLKPPAEGSLEGGLSCAV